MNSALSSAIVIASLVGVVMTPAMAQPPLQTLSASTSSELIPGSFTNDVLRRDTAMTLVEHGYIKPLDDITPFVIEHPTGSTGKKTWRELWVTTPDHHPAYFAITFKEDGKGSTDFAITPIYE